jgi:hypothetical protein
MSDDPNQRVTAAISLPTAVYNSAAEYSSRPVAAEQIPLGWFDGVTAPGYRLVWEDGSLLLIAIGGLKPERDFVKGIRGRLEWIAKNHGIVQDRVRAVMGRDADARDFGIRVVVAAQSQSLTDALGALDQRVEVHQLKFYYEGNGALRHSSTSSRISGTRRRKSAIGRPAPSKRRAGSSKAGPSTVSPYTHDLLVELRHTATAALCRTAYIDPVDWRTSPELNLLRAYALLVVIAGRAVVEGTLDTPASTKDSTLHQKQPLPSRFLNAILDLLKSFATCAADESLSQSSRSLGKAVVSFVDKALNGHAFDNEGAYLGPLWKEPVPPSIDALVSEMAKPSTVSQRDLALANAKGPEASLLADANCGIASAVQLAQTFDAYPAPSRSSANESLYRTAALVRVLAGHRLLVDVLGVPTRAAIMAMLGLAEDVAISKTLDVFFTDDARDARYLVGVRRRAAALLKESGKLCDAGKQPAGILQIAHDQESRVVEAIEASIRVEG